MSIYDNYCSIRDAVAEAAITAGRDPKEVRLIGVTKFHPIADIEPAVAAGLTSVGENRVQELLEKFDYFHSAGLDVNLIGQLQTNKVKYVIGKVSLIQSMDRLELAKEVDKRARAASLVQDVLIEVNIGGEEQKGGILPEQLPDFLGLLSDMPGIRVKGLMCIPPAVGEQEARGYFAAMRKLFFDLKAQRLANIEMEHLSMGMSGDYRAAILEGATMVRVGTAIFGVRK